MPMFLLVPFAIACGLFAYDRFQKKEAARRTNPAAPFPNAWDSNVWLANMELIRKQFREDPHKWFHPDVVAVCQCNPRALDDYALAYANLCDFQAGKMPGGAVRSGFTRNYDPLGEWSMRYLGRAKIYDGKR